MRILKRGGRAQQLNVALPPEIHRWLRKEAKKRETSVASIVRQILVADYQRRAAA